MRDGAEAEHGPLFVRLLGDAPLLKILGAGSQTARRRATS
jgi:hypothetical protein